MADASVSKCTAAIARLPDALPNKVSVCSDSGCEPSVPRFSENFPSSIRLSCSCKHIFRFELLGISQHYSILWWIDFQHISWFSQCDFKSLSVARWYSKESPYALPASPLFRIDKPSRAYFICLSLANAHAGSPDNLLYEAYFHALSFLGFRCIAFILR